MIIMKYKGGKNAMNVNDINIGDVILAECNGKSMRIKVSSIKGVYQGERISFREPGWKGYKEVLAKDVVGVYRCEACGREAVSKTKCYCEYCKKGRIKLIRF